MSQVAKNIALSLGPVGLAFVLLLRLGFLDAFHYLILPSLVISLMATYLTSLVCRIARERRWRLNWSFGLLGALLAEVLVGCFSWPALSLEHGSWGKSDPLPYFLWMGVSGFVFAILPAELVVWHFRHKTKSG